MELVDIATQFQLEGEIENVKPLGDGFINDTFTITTKGDSPNYILQRKNNKIFTDIPAMMNNIKMVTEHLKKKIVAAGGDPLRESLTVIPAKDGNLYFQDPKGDYWAVCIVIPNIVDYATADTPHLAECAGRGIGKFQKMLSDFTEPLADILPGFHNMRFRVNQWDTILAKDPVGRKAALAEEINFVEERKAEMLKFWELVETKQIPTRVTHNDTKINNILFDKNECVVCVIDLDTVLSSTCLNDFGDAIRYMANTGLEDDQDLNNVNFSLDMFRAYAKGYISEAGSFLTDLEVEYLAFSAKFITYEQIIRFLMDYIDGDNYYKIKYPEHNLVRTRAQIKLLTSMESHYDEMKQVVKEEVARVRGTQ